MIDYILSTKKKSKKKAVQTYIFGFHIPAGSVNFFNISTNPPCISCDKNKVELLNSCEILLALSKPICMMDLKKSHDKWSEIGQSNAEFVYKNFYQIRLEKFRSKF